MPKVSIGLPVYNGEQFIQRRIDSILAQTFTDFELIISDNASTDHTSVICEDYAKKDKRIRYIRQEQNMGPYWNFYFVLEQARYEYFVWAAADDFWYPDFLKKNINILESKKNVVASMSKIEIGDFADPFTKEKALLKKFGLEFRPLIIEPIMGSYEKRVRTYLKMPPWEFFYAVYRTDKLRNSIIHEYFVGTDAAIVLSTLKHGDFDVVNEFLFRLYPVGVSSKGLYPQVRFLKHRFLWSIFPMGPFTIWCAKHLGIRLFLRNMDYFLRLNVDFELVYIIDLIRFFKTRKSHRKSS